MSSTHDYESKLNNIGYQKVPYERYRVNMREVQKVGDNYV